MKIIPLINEFTNSFNKIFQEDLNPLNLESKIKDVGDTFTLLLYEKFLNYIDDKFKNSKERKENYNIKETRKRTLVTSIGCININSTSYYNKETKERFVLLREILHLKPYQRLTNEAEHQLIKYAMDENMSQSARHALRNTQVSRSTVSKKIAKLDSSIIEYSSMLFNEYTLCFYCPFIVILYHFKASFLDRFNLPLLSYPSDLTIISSPTFTTSLGFSTLSSAK